MCGGLIPNSKQKHDNRSDSHDTNAAFFPTHVGNAVVGSEHALKILLRLS